MTVTTAAALAVLMSGTTALIIVLILVALPILYWIFRGLTGKLGR
jgi:hypothetical protein